MASQQGKSAEPQYTDLETKFEWKEDPANHVLLVQLPGFRKEEFGVQLDSSGKVTVKGQRHLGGGKYARFHSVFQAPANSNIDSISGRLERGCLSVIFPKKVVKKEEKHQEGEGGEKMKSKSSEKAESPKEKEETKSDDKVESAKEEGEPKSSEKKEEDSAQKPTDEETKEATPKIPSGDESKPSAGHDGKVKEIRKKVVAWKERISTEWGGLCDSGLIDNVMETIEKNKMVIAVAVTSVSIGLLVFHKLKSSGK